MTSQALAKKLASLADTEKAAREAYLHALSKRRTRHRELEPIISQSAQFSVMYARDVLAGPFPAGEEAVASSARYSVEYALVVARRFPAGEDAIAKSARWAVAYARLVIKGRFPAGEEVIATEAHQSLRYAQEVLRQPFPEGEPAIATDPQFSYYYARYVLRGPFPAGEQVIVGSTWEPDYVEKVLTARPEL